MVTNNPDSAAARPVWFVGAAFGSTDDQTERFLEEGIWEGGSHNPKTAARYEQMVRSIELGDKIAIKAAYTRKKGLPFDNRGFPVSVMRIKATGTVRANPLDGRSLQVDWQPIQGLREWYFYTNRPTIWQIQPTSGDFADALVRFTFDGENQDINRFRNHPSWRERFGDAPPDDPRFAWTRFYSEFADRLLQFRHDRGPLVAAIQDLAREVTLKVTDQYADGSSGPLTDICPFTTIGLFNRGMSDVNRRELAGRLAEVIGVESSAPETFEGIPVLNNMNSWFFPYESRRDADHIDALWNVFESALNFADVEDDMYREEFISSFDNAMARRLVGPRLTTGLYWIRAWDYLTLDGRSVQFMKDELKINAPSGRPNAEEYLELQENLVGRFAENDFPVHSFPELSLAAWQSQTGKDVEEEDSVDHEEPPTAEPGPEVATESLPPYTIDDIVGDGCFLERERLESILQRLQDKKNLILQGPPGTGKTWLAKRLAFALIGSRAEQQVHHMQFHPNLSYEDFVRGWRPSGGSGLTLVDGPFLQVAEEACNAPGRDYVMVIEEINRGTPAQIFGEMLTLVENDKRNPNYALRLSYPKNSLERVFLPPNLYLIGTMNVADRSRAMLDLALRRRFGFVDLEPTLGDKWRQWVSEHCDLDIKFLQAIEIRMNALNETIASDPGLGPQFRIGHSVVTPDAAAVITHPERWFRQVVETEIGPLLDEYWFDDNSRAKEQRETLLSGLGE